MREKNIILYQTLLPVLFTLLMPSLTQAFSATLTENFTTETYYNSTSSSNVEFNMGLGQIRAQSIVQGTADIIDIGNGSDGECQFSSTISSGIYNCKSLVITGTVNVAGSAPLIFKVQGNATISGTLNISGQNGLAPIAATSEGAAGAGGPGGFPGGNCPAGNNSNGSDGSGDGRGIGGIFVGATGIGGSSGGGGGGGGAYTANAATAGSNGADDGFGSHGTGGAAGSAYGNQNLFLTTLVGGSGGGAGSAGNQFGGVHTYFTGGGAGGGGGALKLTVGGNLTIENTGSILANGGNGGNGQTFGGGGGGGSGGAIFIQSIGEFRNDGSVTALGGTQGAGGGAGANGGNGGNGGDGRVRVDTANGSLTGSGGDPNPAPQNPSGTNVKTDVDYRVNSITFVSRGYDTGISGSVNYQSVSKTVTLSGGTINLEFADSDDNISYGSYINETNISNLTKRYIRFRATILPSGTGETTPILSNIEITYQDNSLLSERAKTYTSTINCGTIALKENNIKDKITNSLLNFLLGFTPLTFIYALIMARKRKED